MESELEKAILEIVSSQTLEQQERRIRSDSRLDKAYGLTDYISMNVCRELPF